MSWKGFKWTKPYLDSGIMIIANHKLLYRKSIYRHRNEGFFLIDHRANRFFIHIYDLYSDDGHCAFRDLFSFGWVHWYLLSKSQSVDNLCNSTLAVVRDDYFDWIPWFPTTSCPTLPKAQVFLDQRVLARRSTCHSECCKSSPLCLSLCYWLSNMHTSKISRSNILHPSSYLVVAIDPLGIIPRTTFIVSPEPLYQVVRVCFCNTSRTCCRTRPRPRLY
jgi:hypothetical protein